MPMHGPLNVKLCFAVNVFVLSLCAKCGRSSLTLCAIYFTIYLIVLDIVKISNCYSAVSN
jgi:hypothetical protein